MTLSHGPMTSLRWARIVRGLTSTIQKMNLTSGFNNNITLAMGTISQPLVTLLSYRQKQLHPQVPPIISLRYIVLACYLQISRNSGRFKNKKDKDLHRTLFAPGRDYHKYINTCKRLLNWATKRTLVSTGRRVDHCALPCSLSTGPLF